MMKSYVARTITALSLTGLIATSAAASVTMTERQIPTPVGVSSNFAAIVDQKVYPMSMPIPATTEEWLAARSLFDAPHAALALEAANKLDVSYERKQFAGVDTYFVSSNTVSPQYQDRWLVHIHGGAFVFGGGDAAIREAIWIADGLKANVISINYRQPPEHPFPAAINDVVSVWKELIKTQPAEKTAIFGSSAGGNLTLATTLKLKDLGLPLPGALFAGTPAVDLKETSDTWITLQGLDPLGSRDGVIDAAFNLYAGEEPLGSPLLSPVYGDVRHFPPTILISGTRDLLLSDTVRMHRALRAQRVDAELHIYDGQSHGDYIPDLTHDFPEADDAIEEISRFFNRHLK
ncbi:alpha/beta hydrolase [Vibrio sp. ZSDZ34]|jgi:acetyl esterase/lipase|uniref:Alpha/beta hydrolase n=1 Tax=Vibrio gelatinilyticus TaxID=2893468 RepID=A0A9X1W9T1_9VIBR|nr:alpha/beta hydrolase [Vibrio gelatinilyticus]MCJ2376942.1 alpha/beta hydrolase [Vibrio gelatinilyticus]